MSSTLEQLIEHDSDFTTELKTSDPHYSISVCAKCLFEELFSKDE